MIKTLEAIFDGEVLRPEEPLELQPNTRVRITIEVSDALETRARSFLRTARSLNLEGPSDWSARIEDYLYEKQSDAHD
ncbi:MAG: antitoxin family protein [Abditibacteriales bacterium]|nr:antitoxin family protein [Abditibacteriales bacterium]MDW8364492.1 antitoxin family protein [Abditibacteriales bacterium]